MFRSKNGTKIQDKDYRKHYAKTVKRLTIVAERNEVADELAAWLSDECRDTDAFGLFVDNEYGPEMSELAGSITLSELGELTDRFEDVFAGHWDSENDYTENAIADGAFGDLGDDVLTNYIDTQSLTRDLFKGGDMYSLPSRLSPGIFAFHNC